jgi:hypothetical protein
MRNQSHSIWLFDIISFIKMNCSMGYLLLGVGAFMCHFVGGHWCTWYHIAPFTSLHKKFFHWRLTWIE